MAEFDLRVLPVEARGVFQSLLGEARVPAETLREQADAYCASFGRRSAADEFVSAADAERIRRHCGQLLSAVDAGDEEAYGLVQAAVRYFVLEEDGDSDFAFGGLDDDLAVVLAVAAHLGVALDGEGV